MNTPLFLNAPPLGKEKLNFSVGKTTVGKLYGGLLAKLGLLSKGDLIVKNGSDFITQHVSESLVKTKKILEEARGNVLLIDEAYVLGGERKSGRDEEVVDTIVAEVQNTPSEDICVILCGYKEEMETFLRKSNPGLLRCFPLEDAFEFEEFSQDDLGQIFDQKISNLGMSTTKEGRAVALDLLSLAKQRANFGNAGEIDNILSRANLSFQARFGFTPIAERRKMTKEGLLLPADFDPDYQLRLEAKDTLEDDTSIIDLERVKSMFEAATRQARIMKKCGRDPKKVIPFTLVFMGPPGSGKTTFARHLGRIYHKMGVLGSSEVVEALVKDMVAGYIGQTALKTGELLDRALGKVLLIDEAYRLSDDTKTSASDFAREACDELIDSLTKPKYFRKVVVVLSGYKSEMEDLFERNRGLSSRFPTRLDFEGGSLDQAACRCSVRRSQTSRLTSHLMRKTNISRN